MSELKRTSFKNAIVFLLLASGLDFLFRKGFLAYLIPSPLPKDLTVMVFFALFAAAVWWLSRGFAKRDQMQVQDLGIDFKKQNRRDFFLAFVLGIMLWALVALSQAYFAGFTWTLREGFQITSLVHGLLFIFIADLGTELYMRPYPLSQLENGWGGKIAIGILLLFELIKSLAYNVGEELFLYAVIIPVLHVGFFSIIYLKTKRIGAPLGLHTGANLVTISIFDLREEQAGQAIPAGMFRTQADLETLSVEALQLPWVIMASLLLGLSYIWWRRSLNTPKVIS